jgi:hypothetical protein
MPIQLRLRFPLWPRLRQRRTDGSAAPAAVGGFGTTVVWQMTAATAALVFHASILITVPAVHGVPRALSHRDGAMCPTVPTL